MLRTKRATAATDCIFVLEEPSIGAVFLQGVEWIVYEKCDMQSNRHGMVETFITLSAPLAGTSLRTLNKPLPAGICKMLNQISQATYAQAKPTEQLL